MGIADDFVIENGRLKEYLGSGGAVTVPEGVVEIRGGSFTDCQSLTAITFPESLMEISDWAFSGCTNLCEVKVHKDNPRFSAADGILYNKRGNVLLFCPAGKTGILKIPDCVTAIDAGACTDCDKLTGVLFPEGLKEIDMEAFSCCDHIRNITFPENVTDIGHNAFSCCNSLTEVVLPEWLLEFDRPFDFCYNLTSVTFPAGITDIGPLSFEGCDMLLEVKVDENNSLFSAADGILYDKCEKTLLFCPAGRSGNLTVPEGVTEIGEMAFAGCTRLVNVVLPDGVLKIGEAAFKMPDFKECAHLSNLRIPASVTEIDENAFDGCPSLMIHAPAGSFAERYAESHGILFEAE